jgi:hypothetical protein
MSDIQPHTLNEDTKGKLKCHRCLENNVNNRRLCMSQLYNQGTYKGY